MNLPVHDTSDTVAPARKAWIDPGLEEFDVQEVSEGADGFGAEFGLFS